MGFVNAELERAGFDPIPKNRFVDTLKIARAKFPGSPASLDALCKRFSISLNSRTKHGALVDSELLAEVYLDLSGGRMRRFGFDDRTGQTVKTSLVPVAKSRPTALKPRISENDITRHQAFIEKLGGGDKNMVWQNQWAKSTR